MHKPLQPTKPDTTPPAAPRPDAVQLRARRSPRLIALGVLLIVLGGLGAAALFTANSDHRPVLTMARDVSRGDTIERADLAVVEVPGTLAVEALPADAAADLIGQHALSDLPQGSFPLPRHVGDDPLPAGETLVGLRLPPGRLPASPLPPGTLVRLVGLAEGSDASAEAVVAIAPRLLDDGATYALDVRLPDATADLVARLSAADQLAVVVIREA